MQLDKNITKTRPYLIGSHEWGRVCGTKNCGFLSFVRSEQNDRMHKNQRFLATKIASAIFGVGNVVSHTPNAKAFE